MTEQELKPCPFCEGTAVRYSSQGQHDPLPVHRIECESCGVHRQWRKTIEDAIADWNARPGEAQALQAERARLATMARQKYEAHHKQAAEYFKEKNDLWHYSRRLADSYIEVLEWLEQGGEA